MLGNHRDPFCVVGASVTFHWGSRLFRHTLALAVCDRAPKRADSRERLRTFSVSPACGLSISTLGNLRRLHTSQPFSLAVMFTVRDWQSVISDVERTAFKRAPTPRCALFLIHGGASLSYERLDTGSYAASLIMAETA